MQCLITSTSGICYTRILIRKDKTAFSIVDFSNEIDFAKHIFKFQLRNPGAGSAYAALYIDYTVVNGCLNIIKTVQYKKFSDFSNVSSLIIDPFSIISSII